MPSAIDRVFERPGPVDWSTIRRIVRRQQSSSVTRESLKKILPAPSVPLDLVEELLQKLWFHYPIPAPGAFCSEGADLTREYVGDVWRRIFLRPAHARLFSSAVLPARSDAEMFFASIHNEEDLEDVPLLRQAYAKTRLILKSFQSVLRMLEGLDLTVHLRHGDSGKTESFRTGEGWVDPDGSLLSLLLHGRHPNFLVYLQAVLHPEELDRPDRRGRLPLHLAAEQARRGFAGPLDKGFFRLGFQDDTTGAHDMRFELLNRTTPIGLLAFLRPSAGRCPDRAGRLPLEAYLAPNGITKNPPYCPGRRAERMKVVVEDLLCLFKPAPQALVSRSLSGAHLYPFLVPPLAGRRSPGGGGDDDDDEEPVVVHWHRHSDGVDAEVEEERGCRELNLVYTLLRANPTALALATPRKRGRDDELPCCTMYEGVLKKRLRRARVTLRALEEEERSLLAQIREQERERKELLALPG